MTPHPKRILFVLTSHDRKGAPGDTTAAPSGFYLSEVSHPYHVLHAAGYGIDFVSPKGGKTHVDGLDLNDAINAEFWNNPALRAQTENTLAPAAVRPADYAAIFYAGGHATMWDFADNAELATIAAQRQEGSRRHGTHSCIFLCPLIYNDLKSRQLVALTSCRKQCHHQLSKYSMHINGFLFDRKICAAGNFSSK